MRHRNPTTAWALATGLLICGCGSSGGTRPASVVDVSLTDTTEPSDANTRAPMEDIQTGEDVEDSHTASDAAADDVPVAMDDGTMDVGAPEDADAQAPTPHAWWPLDEGTGQRVTDATGNGFDGWLGGNMTAQTADPTWQ